MTDTQFDADAILAKFEFAEREISRLEVLIENEISAGSVHKLRRIGQKADWFLQDMRGSFFHLDDTQEESYYKRLVVCEDKILDLWTKLDAQFCNLEETKNTINNSNSDQLKSNLRLPKIELKIFDGEKTSWLSYKEMFLNSIDKNDKLTDQEKCSYLFSSLKAQPLKLISGFPISAASYKEAWNSLLNRYDNKRQLSHALLAKFLNVKPIKTCTQKAILELLDTCNESIRNLKTLNYEFNDFVNLILVDLIQNKLEDSLRKEWELSLEGDTIPTYDSLILFLEKYAKSLQGINEGSSRNESKSTFKPEFKSYSGKRSVANAAIADLRCKSIKNCWPACKNEHLLYQCPELQKMSLDQRWDLVKKKRLCSNCLRGNHFQSRCVISSNCKICEQRHHTALHRDKIVNCNSNALPQNTQASTLTEYTPNVHAPEFQSVTAHMVKENHRTLLSTATVHIETCFGQKITCKALLDSGSQKSLVSQAFSKKLGLPIRNTKHRLSGINNLTAETALKEMSLKVSPYFNKETFAIDVLVVNQITTNLPNFVFKTHKWPHLAGLQLADPNYQQSSPIDLLIGADVYTELVLGETILGPKGSPNALKSKLGWLLSGVIYAEPQEQNITCHMLTQLETNIQKFWELEAVPQPNFTPSVDDTYSKTVARTSEGRYIVTLPFKSPPDLGNTETQALKRLQYLETKLAKNPALKSEYSAFMEDYLKAGHMELVPDSETSDPTKIYYLPHHSVLREESVSTRLRVVFDASAKGSKGKSLNDFLEIGPKLQPNILNLLVKFRTYPIALVADIQQMFRQILVDRSQTDFQRIFWRFSAHEPIQTYRLLTVTYGCSSSPYLAIRTLHELAKDNEVMFPQIAKIIRENFYVDDLLVGANSLNEAQHILQELMQVMQSGGFTLRKWSSNIPEAIGNIPPELKSNQNQVNIQADQSLKILGLVWNSSQDVLQIQINHPKSVVTKRDLLSVIATIFDPLGVLSPSTVLLKLMMQEIWKEGVSWDNPIPESVRSTWDEFSSQIHLLKNIKIPRYLKIQNKSDSIIEMHGFCDGSGKAYAAVVYIRVITPGEGVTVNFLASKTRVNPIKAITLPRIELCAAFLLAQLCAGLMKVLSLDKQNLFMWSDSTIVLSWLQSPPIKGNQFVTNRINQINALLPGTNWKHTPGKINPADSASRGILPEKLLNHQLWWSGPDFLWSPQSFETLEDTQTEVPPDNNLEVTTTLTTEIEVPQFFKNYSSFDKLIRITSYVLRFIKNIRNRHERSTGFLTSHELSNAIKVIVKSLQHQAFPREINALKKNEPISSKSKFLPLNLFLDPEGLLRVGGRLSKHSTLSLDQKHPMLIPRDHFVTKILIHSYHLKFLHAGPQLVLSMIRQKYWIVNGRSTVRQVLNQLCLLCKKLKPQACQQLMGELPLSRITMVRPFSRVGLDFAGPILTKPNLQRSKVKIKSYICVFVCMATKSLHLEAVSDLSSQALLAALRRFIGRRGLPTEIFSDNGRNFRGLANKLKSLYNFIREKDIQDFATMNFIKWTFITTYAPHQGGLWEAAVKLTKTHLIRTCKRTILNFEELSTLLCQIEACVNSRPLIPLSADPSDFRALTPGHFLVGGPLLDLPDSTESPSLSTGARWRVIQQSRAYFWRRWSCEYLHHLQQRQKWTTTKPSLQTGDLVLLHDPQLPALQWKLGRIQETFPGSDGLVRVVSVKTSDGLVKRPITKLSLLISPGEDEESH